MSVNSAHFDGPNPSVIGVVGTLGTADTGGTALTLPIGVNPATGAMYVQDLSGASGTTNVLLVGGTLNAGTVTTTLTLNTGTITTIAAGTLNTLGTVGTLNGIAAGDNNIGNMDVATGTVTLVSTVTTVSNLTNGSVNVLTGTVTSVSNLAAGTVQLNPVPVPTILALGTLGTAGGSFFATISAASGAGTKHYVSGVDVVMDSGTADVRVLAGSVIQGTGVLAAGKFPAGGGISKVFNPAFATGTNSELIYHFVGAGTAFITVDYWKGA